jgi:acetylglutamate kinase
MTPRPVVYKVGGPALEDAALFGPLAAEVKRAAGPVLLVHGGGRQVDRLLKALGIESHFVNGRRRTSDEAMEVVEMVLSGTMNKTLAAGLTAAGLQAIGISGRDAGIIRARLQEGLGRVGSPETVDPEPILALWAAGFVPVISPVSGGPAGEAVNVNADEAALGLAQAVRARALVYLSDVDGVRLQGTGAALELDAEEASRRIDDGTIAGGMSLKVRVALEAAASGIPEVVVAGRARLLGGFAGTRIVAPARSGARA